MTDRLVVLFEGDAQGDGLRLIARTRNKTLIRQVERWFAKRESYREQVAAFAKEKPPPSPKGR